MRRRRLRAGEHVERALRRGRVRVVAVVDDRDAAGQPHDLAAMRRRPQRRRLSPRSSASGTSNSSATAVGGEDVREVPATDERRRRPRRCRAASSPARWCHRSRDRRRAMRARRRRDRCRTSRPGRRNDATRAAIRGSSAFATSSVEALAPSRISAFASAIASTEAKKPECASPTLVHTRTSGSATRTSVLISPAWFIPSSTTAISGRCRSSDQRQRQPDVVVEIAPVADHAIPRREKLAGHFLRRGLARAAGNGHDLGARFAPNRVPQRLQRHGRVVDLDDRRPP